MARFGNIAIIIIMLNLTVLVFLMSRIRCYALNILLSTPSGTVFLKCWLVKHSALAIGLSTMPHQKTL